MRKKIIACEAPSIRADSSNSLGMVSKYPFIIQTQSGMAVTV